MSQISERKIESLCAAAAARLAALGGPNVPLTVQAQTVKILAKTHYQKASEKVVSFFTDHPDLEDSILAISELSPELAVTLLVNRIHEKRALNRDVIAEQLGKFKSPASFECLNDLLGDEDRHVRYQAANSLFTLGGNDSALALCRYISDPDEWISMSILKLLCRMKEHESIPFLAEQFTKDPDIRRKAQMVSFLSMFRSVTLVNIFDEGLRGKDARLKANSIEAIGELDLPQREIKQRIQPFLRDPNNRIRANAILALAKSEPETIRPEIVQMVESSDVQLRRSAAYILGQISAAGNEPLVEKLVVDSAPDVRKRMVLSLRAFPREFVQKQLEKSCIDQNKWIRKYSIEQAANFPDFPKAIIIKQLKTETVYPNLVACMDFFGRHPDEEGARLIRHRVKDKRDQVVSGVIRAVGAMFGVKGLQAIAPQVDYKNPRILRTFVVTHFSLGGIEMLGQILEKAAHVRSSVLDNPYLDSIEGCLDLLNMRDKMPKDLFAELSKASMAEAVPVPSPVVTPIAVPPPVAMPVPPAFQPLVFEPQPQPQPQVPTQPMPQYQPQPVPQLQPQLQPQPQVIPVTMPMPQPIPVTMPMPQPQTQAPYEPAPMASPPVPLPPLFSPVPLPAQAVEPVLNEPLLPRVDIEVAEGPRKPKSKPPAEFRSGVKYFNLGKYSKAKKSFNSALQEHPDLVKAFLYLGLIAFEEKEFETARDHLLRFLESNPGNRKANLVMVKIFKQLREWTNLVGILERLLGLDYVCDESNIKLMKELGSAYIFVREFEKAKQTLETVFHFDPTDPQSDYHLAMSYFHLQDFTKAEALLRDILREVPQGNRLQVMAESLMEKIRQSLTGALAGEQQPSSPRPTVPPEPEPEQEPEPKPEPAAIASELPPLGLGDNLGLPGIGNLGAEEKPFLDLSDLDTDPLREEIPGPKPGISEFDLDAALFPTEQPGKPPASPPGGPSLSFLGEIPEGGGVDGEFPSITMPGTLDDLPPAPSAPPVASPAAPRTPSKKKDEEPPDDEGGAGGFNLPSL